MNPASEHAKPNLLIIDDEIRVSKSLSRLLSRAYEVTTASSGSEGLRLAIDNDWDAILCDVMMPDLGGLELFRRLGEVRSEMQARMGFMTGGTFEPSTEAFLNNHAGGWLAKPFKLSELRAFLDKLVDAA